MSTITDQIGRELAGRYLLEAGLGTGASAHVYAALDQRLRRQVAVKVLHPGLSGDAAFLRRFSAEAQAVAALHHPNLAQVLDWGEEEEGPFIVLEYLSGGSLRDMLDTGSRLSVAQVAAVGAAAARGLAYAHRRGLIHRDVKPANLLFDEDGGVRVADFGLARALAEAAWTEPAGAILGTARYASPEQAEGRPLDERSDVYSLALVCYEAVTGRVPFSGETTLATLMARIGAVLPPAPELGPLAPILAQAAISEPLARLDADELAASLEMLARSLSPPSPLPLAPRSLVRPDEIASPTSSLAGGAVDHRGADRGAHRAGGREADRDGGRTDQRGTDDSGVIVDGEPSGELAEESVPPRRRRRALRAVVVFALLVVVVGGGVVAVKLIGLSKTVPRLAGVGLSGARSETVKAGLRLEVAGKSYSTTVPLGAVLSERPAAGSTISRGSPVRVVVSRGEPPVPIPKVVGEPEATAVGLVTSSHLVPDVVEAYSSAVPPGRVVSTLPATGLLAYSGRLELDVSKGPAPVTIPALGATATWASSSSSLQRLGLKPIEELAYSSSVSAGLVISTSPAEGAKSVPVGTRVTVTVSRGPQLVAVPSVSGDSIASAVAALRSAGLVVSEQVGPPFATSATTTDPAPGTEVRPGSDVTLYVA